MEEINKEKELIKKKDWTPKIVLIIVIIVLAIVGYVFSEKDSLRILKNEEIPIIGNLDYQTPFDIFSELPIEQGIELDNSTLTSYQGGSEIQSISYNSNKTEEELFIDFFNYLENNGWIMENTEENIFIYAIKYPETLNILIEKDKEGNVLVNISHTKLGETE
jgi:hypothetical protein